MAATRTFLEGRTSGTDSSTYTFSGVNLGTEAADRYIVVCVQGRRTAALSVSTVTVGGVSATSVVQRENTASGNTIAAIFIVAVPTGTTGDIVVTFSAASLRCAIQVYRVIGIASATAHDTDSSVATDPSVALDVPAGGVAIGCGASGTAAGSKSATWTGLTEDSDTEIEVINATSGSAEFATQQTGLTITIDFTVSSNQTGVFASWGPAASSVKPWWLWASQQVIGPGGLI